MSGCIAAAADGIQKGKGTTGRRHGGRRRDIIIIVLGFASIGGVVLVVVAAAVPFYIETSKHFKILVSVVLLLSTHKTGNRKYKVTTQPSMYKCNSIQQTDAVILFIS